jgi:hypothetical protein
MLSKFVVSMVCFIQRRLGRQVRHFLTHGLQTNASLGFLGDMWTGGAVEVRAAVALCASPAHGPVYPVPDGLARGPDACGFARAPRATGRPVRRRAGRANG